MMFVDAHIVRAHTYELVLCFSDSYYIRNELKMFFMTYVCLCKSKLSKCSRFTFTKYI